MKFAVLFGAFIFLFIGVALAQDNKNDKLEKQFPQLKLDTSSIDSNMKNLKFKLDSSLMQKYNPIPMPNAYSISGQQFIYTMPIKKISGEGLAPMPGTENLDRLESKSLNAIELKGKDKK